MTGARRAVHAFHHHDTHDGWNDTAAEHGVSVSALIEAIGRSLAPLLDQHPDIVRVARRVDAERRQRNGR